ncbi:MAG: undecaprenyl-phosphate glucose phosphotransferase [Prevotella sp.]|nr:undecaprenyl-phosphate glucose phosphotransferase [Prevotella sp.]
MKQYPSGTYLIMAFVVLGDFILLNALLIGFILFFPDWVPEYFHHATRITVLVANMAMGISQYFYQTVVHYRQTSFEAIFTRVSKLIILQVTLMFVFLRFLTSAGGFFSFMVIFGITFFVATMLVRFFERYIVNKARSLGRNSTSVLFVGNDPALKGLYEDYMSNKATGYRVRGYYAVTEIENAPASLVHLGTIQDLNQQMDKHKAVPTGNGTSRCVDEVFCSLPNDMSAEILRLMRYCDLHMIHFYYVPRIYGTLQLHLKPQRFGTYSLFTNYEEPLASLLNKFCKRTFDIVFSCVVCLCLLPVIPLFALIIKRQSPGPIFFRQKRTGLNGETFTCYKFRSMHVNKDADKSQATKNDPRKFPFGQFMRRTNIDELPQFFNVLKGNMSVVGPRPHMLHHTEIYSKLIDKYMVRHYSKPGITGWSQVTGYRGETKELWQMEARVKRDIWYIENWTFWLDIKIIFMTMASSLHPNKNAY